MRPIAFGRHGIDLISCDAKGRFTSAHIATDDSINTSMIKSRSSLADGTNIMYQTWHVLSGVNDSVVLAKVLMTNQANSGKSN